MKDLKISLNRSMGLLVEAMFLTVAATAAAQEKNAAAAPSTETTTTNTASNTEDKAVEASTDTSSEIATEESNAPAAESNDETPNDDSVEPNGKPSEESAEAEAAVPASDATRESPETSSSSNSQSFEAAADAFLSTIGVRRLTAESFPAILGIQNGSLAQTSHGLQWPYVRKSGIGLSGYVWIDTGYEKIDREEDDNQANTKYVLQEGRFLLRVTPTFSKGRWFIQGQAEMVANKDQSSTQPSVVDADDVWGKVGMWDLFDFQVGRFEAWELYHFGMGMDINTLERRGATESNASDFSVPDVYGVTFAYYRPSGVGNIAAHVYPTKFFRLELLGQLGNQGSLNTAAFRGAGILDFGFVKVKGGGEYIRQKSAKEGPDERADRGVGGTVQFVLDPYVEFGVSGAWGITDRINSLDIIDEEGSYTTWSTGGFANVRIIEDLLFGMGVHYTYLEDIHVDETGKVGEFAHLQTFGALQYLLFKRLYLKAVVAWAKGDVDPSFTEGGGHSNYMISGRLRFEYKF